MLVIRYAKSMPVLVVYSSSVALVVCQIYALVIMDTSLAEIIIVIIIITTVMVEMLDVFHCICLSVSGYNLLMLISPLHFFASLSAGTDPSLTTVMIKISPALTH